MKIIEVREDKKRYLPLLLLADEQEDMIDRYLERGTMYVLLDHGAKAECVVTDEGNGILEIKNIAVLPEHQGKGYGKALIEFLVERHEGRYAILQGRNGRESPDRSRFTRDADSFALTASKTSSSTTTTIRFSSAAFNWST